MIKSPGFTYWTADGLKMWTWNRKKKLKFRKRWRKQHGGKNFCWFIGEWKFVTYPVIPPDMVFLVREE